MISYRIFIALMFAILLAVSFHQSWRREKRIEGFIELDNEKGETYVFIHPVLIMVSLLTCLAVYCIVPGVQQGVHKFSLLVADIIVNSTPYYILLLVILPLLRKVISAKACAVLWLFPIFLYYQPQTLFNFSYVPLLTFYVPEKLLHILLYIWVIGFVAILLWKWVGHISFRHYLAKKSKKVDDPCVLDIWEDELSKGKYKKEVELYYSENAKTPLSIGLFNHTRVVVLPYKSYSEEELRFTFCHEITHLKRLDIETKVILTLYLAFSWFNPLTWIAVRKANEDLELSCDELVLRECDEAKRKRYAELLLQTAGNAKGFTTCLSVDAKALRYRLKNVVNRRKLHRGTILIAVIFFCFYMSYGVTAITTNRESVKNLLFSSDKNLEISSMVYEKSAEDNWRVDISSYDEERIVEYISNLEVEKYVGVNDLMNNEAIIIGMEISGIYQELHLSENLLTIANWRQPDEYYIIKSEVDWDHIMSCIEF